MKYMLDNGFLHGECLTVTGKTLAENLEKVQAITPSLVNVIHPLETPIKASGHLCILSGNLAPEGAVAKITGKEGSSFTGPAHVFKGTRMAGHMGNETVKTRNLKIAKIISEKNLILVNGCRAR